VRTQRLASAVLVGRGLLTRGVYNFHCPSFISLYISIATINFTNAEQEAFGDAHSRRTKLSDLRPEFLNEITRSQHRNGLSFKYPLCDKSVKKYLRPVFSL
jgi:hypothetical protein